MDNFNIKNISKKCKQFELLDSTINTASNLQQSNNLEIKSETLMIWRNKIYAHQSKISEEQHNKIYQHSILPSTDHFDNRKIDPFILQPLSLNFWRANRSVHDGPAMYFVIDTMMDSEIILYIGETSSANKRWKGDHDCKNYLTNYKEVLASNNLLSHQDIRFFLDVPKEVKLRRRLEQNLICLWLPPFNKETRNRWSTTFTNN